ncbi:hypothetical protein F7725_021849 [Dissostichus mawsoni]|uniref:Uncharacterized protein n=1 Tax=Dissostichus mawsoni TaxID=36200 RepID=A0A7J5ZD13_DISMA|nr:hypothetical protein F7725_021849 [Dissostichus mawsoni]
MRPAMSGLLPGLRLLVVFSGSLPDPPPPPVLSTHGRDEPCRVVTPRCCMVLPGAAANGGAAAPGTMSGHGDEAEESSGSQEPTGAAEPQKRRPGRPRKPQKATVTVGERKPSQKHSSLYVESPVESLSPSDRGAAPKESKNKGPSKAAQKKAEATGEKRPRGRPRKWELLGLVGPDLCGLVPHRYVSLLVHCRDAGPVLCAGAEMDRQPSAKLTSFLCS